MSLEPSSLRNFTLRAAILDLTAMADTGGALLGAHQKWKEYGIGHLYTKIWILSLYNYIIGGS